MTAASEACTAWEPVVMQEGSESFTIHCIVQNGVFSDSKLNQITFVKAGFAVSIAERMGI